MRKIIFGKKGEALTGTIEHAFEVVFPFLAFLAILYVIWHVGSDRTAQTYFQTVEFANIIDAANSFDGQLRIKYVPIQPDFEFNFTNDLLSTTIRDQKANSKKSIHIPKGVFIDNRLALATNGVVKQIQFLKTATQDKVQGSFGIGALSTNSLDNHIYKKDQLLCPTDSQRAQGSVIFTKENRPSDLSDVQLKITGKSPVYLDVTQIANVEPEAKLALQRYLDGLPLVEVSDDASLLVVVRATQSQTPAVLIFTSSHTYSKQVGCNIVSEFAAPDRTTGSSKIQASIVPIAFNPYANKITANKPYVIIELFYTKSNDESTPISKYAPIIAKALKNAYAQVYNE